jgi:iron complex outermembrane receptor protein
VNPQQVDPAAIRFDTRKTVNQLQGGTTIEQRFGADTDLRVTAYGGTRQVRQYLALPGTALTSSGGVTDLDRSFRRSRCATDITLSDCGAAGGDHARPDYETQREHRRGFVNNDGALGDLRRDEDNSIANVDGYLQFEWSPFDAVSVLAGHATAMSGFAPTTASSRRRIRMTAAAATTTI